MIQTDTQANDAEGVEVADEHGSNRVPSCNAVYYRPVLCSLLSFALP